MCNTNKIIDSSSSSSSSTPTTTTILTKYNHIDQLAPAESIAYFYLQKTIGLSSDIMWKITNEAGSVLGFTVPNLKQKITFLKDVMDLSEEDIRIILTKQPSILHLSSDRNLRPKIAFLRRVLDLSKDDLRHMVVSYPCILCYAITNLRSKLFFFRDELGFGLVDDDVDVDVNAHVRLNIGKENGKKKGKNDASELRKLLIQFPKLLIAAVGKSNHDVYHDENGDSHNELHQQQQQQQQRETVVVSDNNLKTNQVTTNNSNNNNDASRRGSSDHSETGVDSTGLIAKVNFLHKEIGIPKHELREIIKKNPIVLLYSLQSNIQPKIISIFIMRLRMNSKQIRKVLTSFPNIMNYNLDNHLLPITRYFLTELEYSPMELRSIVLKFPKVYSHSLFKIKHVVGYLRFQLGMDATQVKRILFQAPQVISLNTDYTLVSKVEFLNRAFGLRQERYIGGSNEGSGTGTGSAILSDGLGDIRKVIAGMPTLLLCSVEKNLRPKADYLLEEFGGDELELRQAVLTLPTLLGYSLEKRIKPRMNQIVDAGIEPIKITVGITVTENNF